MVAPEIDIIIRFCGHVGWLPIIQVRNGWGSGRTVYRGGHHESADEAFQRAWEVWNNRETSDIQELFK